MLVHLGHGESGQPLTHILQHGAALQRQDAHHVGEALQVGVAHVLVGILDVVDHQAALENTQVKSR